MTTVSNLTVNVDVSDEVLELIANLQARVDSLEEVVYEEGCDCDACNPETTASPQPFVVIDGNTYINSDLIKKNNLSWCIFHNDEPEGLEIASENYVEGKSGWYLGRDGVLHIHSGNEKINFYQDGSHNKSNRELFERYDENNTCRVRSGQVEL